ncbi:hypothetical protein GQ42DRAFT_181889 [Ramicandelaber brevisporus]|nr:hypothetical protein GQ42DRAFT_181889 [Ramicandelaber brevisporus]
MNWFIVGAFFNYYLKRFRAQWWERYAFAFSAGMDAGTIISTVIIFFALGFHGTALAWVGNESVCLNAGAATIPPTDAPPAPVENESVKVLKANPGVRRTMFGGLASAANRPVFNFV